MEQVKGSVKDKDPRDSTVAREHPRSYLVVHALAGAIIIALLLWAFASLADEIPERGWMNHTDHALMHFVEAHNTEWGEGFFYVVSLVGMPVLFGIVAIAVIALARRRDWFRASALALTSGGGAALDTLLKHVFHRGRPEYAAEFITHQSWSFPSGHAMNSIISYGMLLWLLLEREQNEMRRRLFIFATVVIVIVVGVSRLYLGVHYLSDVLAGWLAGGAWLIVAITGYRFARLRVGAPERSDD